MMKRVGMIALAVSLLLGGGAAVAVDIDIVALKDDPSPETGFDYVRFRHPAIGDAVTTPVSFRARVKSASAGSRWGIFLDGVGEAGSAIQFQGDLAPESRLFKTLDNPTTNDDGDVAFTARLSGGSEMVGREGDTTVALVGDDLSAAVPPVTGVLDDLSDPRKTDGLVTDDGDVVFRGTISGAAQVSGVDIDEGVFRCTGGDGDCSGGTGTLETLVLRNDPLPDRAGREICSVTTLAASTFGIVMLADTQLDCADDGEPIRRGVLRMPYGGGIVTVALEGEESEPIPGPGGTTYGLFMATPDIANDGTIVFKGRTGGLLIQEVLYLCAAASCPATRPEAAIVEGTVDPDGNAYGSFGTPVVANGGLMAFKAKARGVSGSVRAVYRRQAGGTVDTVIARGDPVPGLLPASEVSRVFGFERVDLSSGGQLAFRAKIKPLAPPRRNRDGIFVADLTTSPSGAFLDSWPDLLR
jgi:hypothetical protein